jgi:hypothetical protein
MRFTLPILNQLLAARENGATLRAAAASVGVHVATVCRWQRRHPEFHKQMREAERAARREKYLARWGPRPRVPQRRHCPICYAQIEVRTASGMITFWRCEHWPVCQWASWRPPAPWNCPNCEGQLYWSHSRKSVGCGECGMRIYTL